jgi:hypothetical protein
MEDPTWEATVMAQSRTVDHITRWRDLLTGELVTWAAGEAVSVWTLPRILPVAVLVPEDMRGHDGLVASR